MSLSLSRCRESTEFAIHLVWLLDTFNPPAQTMAAHRSSSSASPSSSSSVLIRPSSVPTFSYSVSSASLRSIVVQQQQQQQQQHIATDDGNHAVTKPQCDFSPQTLRASLLPTLDNSSTGSSTFLNFVAAAASERLVVLMIANNVCGYVSQLSLFTLCY